MNKGYADLHLEPFVAQYQAIAYGYVIKVKYLKRSERVDESVVAETMRGAREQLAGYLAGERLRRRAPSMCVFRWERDHFCGMHRNGARGLIPGVERRGKDTDR